MNATHQTKQKNSVADPEPWVRIRPLVYKKLLSKSLKIINRYWKIVLLRFFSLFKCEINLTNQETKYREIRKPHVLPFHDARFATIIFYLRKM